MKRLWKLVLAGVVGASGATAQPGAVDRDSATSGHALPTTRLNRVAT